MTIGDTYNRFVVTLLILFMIIWTILAIRPWFRSDWLLENVIVFVGVPALLLMHRHLPLSRISYSLIFMFLCLHEIGAHYTYAEVPYDQWFERLFARNLSEWIGWNATISIV